jgi:hypothetical protein
MTERSWVQTPTMETIFQTPFIWIKAWNNDCVKTLTWHCCICCNPAYGRVDFEKWSAYKIQLHGFEWIVSLSADWDQSPTKKNCLFWLSFVKPDSLSDMTDMLYLTDMSYVLLGQNDVSPFQFCQVRRLRQDLTGFLSSPQSLFLLPLSSTTTHVCLSVHLSGRRSIHSFALLWFLLLFKLLSNFI